MQEEGPVKHSSRRVKFFMATGLLVGYAALVPVRSVSAAPQVCTPYEGSTVPYDPQNVILIVLDDVSWAELPVLNLPIRWPNDDAPPTSPATYKEMLDEARLRRPELNRLAARAHAASAAEDCGSGPAGTTDPLVNADAACLGAAGGGPVVPVDLQSGTPTNVSASAFRYSTLAGADEVHHILQGHGGLSRLAREGVAFSRYYSSSGKCAPSRASIMTGRYPVQVGVPDNGKELAPDQITIASYLKSMCDDDGSANTPCYRTGYIGKWHLGEQRNNSGEIRALWKRGFDEAFYYPGNARKHWSTTPLHCAPATRQFYCTSALSGGASCNSDSTCGAGYVCSANPESTGTGHCYPIEPPTSTICDPSVPSCSGPLCNSTGTACATPLECRAWGAYIGPKERSLCHPDDINNPLCCEARSSGPNEIRADRYRFDKLIGGAKFWNKDRASSRPCDNNANPATTTGCSYDTRYYRDVAKNFILRNAQHSDSEDAERFFLYFAPHALHHASSAPLRTEEHYRTAGLRARIPGNAESFWGALEEIDAAVGQILNMINGYCDGDPSGTSYGTPCTTNDQCTSPATCNTTLRNNTLVLFTSDQGRPSEGYGEPGLRDGKGSMYEGGIRTGLLAWGPGLGIDTTQPDHILEAPVGSHVDLFATIAHAAKCRPDTDLNSEGRYRVKVCTDSTRKFCTQPSDCTGGGGTCQTRLISGHTLLPELAPDIAGSTSIEPRPFAFAQYKAGGKAVVARRDLEEFNVRVCGKEIPKARQTTQPTEPENIERMRRIHSCQVCAGNSVCANSTCWSDGSFCVPSGSKTACEGGSGDCKPDALARCGGKTAQCAGTHVCMQVSTKCEKCAASSAWKLRGDAGDGSAPIDVREMFDLVTNPEEEASGNCMVTPYPTLEPTAAVPPDTTTMEYVQDQLRRRLNGWWDCVTNANGAGIDCDTEKGLFTAY